MGKKAIVFLLVFMAVSAKVEAAKVGQGIASAKVEAAKVGQGIASAGFSMDKCLSIIRQAESSGQDGALGDNGQSRGAYQLQRGTWQRYSKLPWAKYAHDPKESRIVAGCYVADIVRQAKARHGKEFTANPLRVVLGWYNFGHYIDPAKWHRITKNKIYRSV